MNIKSVLTLSLVVCFIAIGNTAFAQKEGKNDTITLTGKIVKEQFVHNKPVAGVYDYFFESGSKKYFVKTYKAKYSKADLDKWVGLSAEVKGLIIERGSWDDNGEGQSRVGEYLLLVEIKPGSYKY